MLEAMPAAHAVRSRSRLGGGSHGDESLKTHERCGIYLKTRFRAQQHHLARFFVKPAAAASASRVFSIAAPAQTRSHGLELLQARGQCTLLANAKTMQRASELSASFLRRFAGARGMTATGSPLH